MLMVRRRLCVEFILEMSVLPAQLYGFGSDRNHQLGVFGSKEKLVTFRCHSHRMMACTWRRAGVVEVTETNVPALPYVHERAVAARHMDGRGEGNSHIRRSGRVMDACLCTAKAE